jgi:hypothetical protein
MTVSLAFMMEVAALLGTGLKVVGAKQLQASKWIDVEKSRPTVWIAISAKRVNERQVIARIHSAVPPHSREQRSVPPELFAETTVLLAEEYPAAPGVEELKLVNSREPLCTGPELYSTRRMFHGPSFHGVVSLDAMAENGLLAKLETLPRKQVLQSTPEPVFHVDPFLMDAAGQLVGYWPIEYCDQGYVLFPIRVEELVLYAAQQQPGHRSVCQLRIRNVGSRQLKADMDLIDDSAKVWMRIIGWEDWRFYWPDNFYYFWRFPNKGQYGLPIDISVPEGFGGVVCRRLEPFGEIDKNIWENLWAHLILSQREFGEYRSIQDRGERWRWICERGAIKESVCTWARTQFGRDLYPADVEVMFENGEATVTGGWIHDLPAPNVTAAYLDRRTVSAAGRCELSIAMEAVVGWVAGPENDRLDERERGLVTGAGLDSNEWLSRLWCAKKAAARLLAGAGTSGSSGGLTVEGIQTETGEITVSKDWTGHSPVTAENAVVSTVCDGDYIIALAFRENHGKS